MSRPRSKVVPRCSASSLAKAGGDFVFCPGHRARIFPAPTAGHTGPALQNNVMYGGTINNPSVGADAYIGPPSYAPHLQGGQSRPPLQPIRRGRCSHRPAHRTSCNASVGDDAYIVPPYRTPCNVSLRSQCAHWLWQSVLLVLCAGVLRIPTTSLRTGLGMTRKFFRLPSLRGRNAPVAIRPPRP